VHFQIQGQTQTYFQLTWSSQVEIKLYPLAMCLDSLLILMSLLWTQFFQIDWLDFFAVRPHKWEKLLNCVAFWLQWISKFQNSYTHFIFWDTLWRMTRIVSRIFFGLPFGCFVILTKLFQFKLYRKFWNIYRHSQWDRQWNLQKPNG